MAFSGLLITEIFHSLQGETSLSGIPFAFIRLTGADTNIYHFLDTADHSKLHVGMTVEAVFREDRVGSMADIAYYRTVESTEEAS